MKPQVMKNLKSDVLMKTAFIGLVWVFPLFSILGMFLDLSSWKSWAALWVVFLLFLSIVLICNHLVTVMGVILDRSAEINHALKKISDRVEAQ